MLTPAQKHLMRLKAAQSKDDQTSDIHPDTSAYDLMRAKLATDKRALKKIQSLELKIQKKRELLPDYEPWIEGVLASDNTFNDEVFMTVLLWQLDLGDFHAALPLATRAIEMGWSLPDSYKRKTATMIAEEVADTSLKLIKADKFDAYEALHEFNALLIDSDMPDEVRAKLHKAIGLSATDNETKLTHFKRAEELDSRSGVIKLIEGVERDMRKAAEAVTANDGNNVANATDITNNTLTSVNHTTSGAESDNSESTKTTQPTADNADNAE